ncbi:N-lysine methyltransferase KMT5A-A-like, partial [Haliotis rubra]|uniref:N-lysine methyltransferase KMT5A-A-like n=1 Tax=Haliotis rubra TaxID=36100 RepID=UPI001EE5DF9F
LKLTFRALPEKHHGSIKLRKTHAPSKCTAADTEKRVTPKEDAKWWMSVGLDKEGFQLKFVSDFVGFGVFATQTFARGDFLLEYRGSLIDEERAKELERKHSKAKEGCYMFYFYFQGKKKMHFRIFFMFSAEICTSNVNNFSIDATEAYASLGRMVNDVDSRHENCVMKLIQHEAQPHLCLFATRDVQVGEELKYDYGDNTVNWRKQIQMTIHSICLMWTIQHTNKMRLPKILILLNLQSSSLDQ